MTQKDCSTPRNTNELHHFIAVNCHPFHDPTDVIDGLGVLDAALSIVRQTVADTLTVRVFWHGQEPDPHVQADLLTFGFAIHVAPHLSNGQNLNLQIDHAVALDCDTFFRVDADDTVTPERFVHQIQAFKQGDADLIGTGLTYRTAKGDVFDVVPRSQPTLRDYLENRFLLHPSLAIRLASFNRQGLRYRATRLEDKALIQDALVAGLRCQNLPILGGVYNVSPKARRAFSLKARGFRLNLELLWNMRSWTYLLYACLLFIAHVALGSEFLRKIRSLKTPMDVLKSHLSGLTKGWFRLNRF